LEGSEALVSEVEEFQSLLQGIDDGGKVGKVMSGIAQRMKALASSAQDVATLDLARQGVWKDFSKAFPSAVREMLRNLTTSHPDATEEIFGVGKKANSDQLDNVSKALVFKLFDESKKDTFSLSKSEGAAFGALQILGQLSSKEQRAACRLKGASSCVLELAREGYSVAGDASFVGTRSAVALTTQRITDAQGQNKIRVEGALTIQTAVLVDFNPHEKDSEQYAIRVGVEAVKNTITLQVQNLATTFRKAIKDFDSCVEVIVKDAAKTASGSAGSGLERPRSPIRD
jgi:hypothetical protein